jgi:hypothetical protein
MIDVLRLAAISGQLGRHGVLLQRGNSLRRIRAGLILTLALSVSVSMAQPVKDGDATRTDKAAKARAEPPAAEVEFWRSAERLNSPAAYKAYLAVFPSGTFSSLARIALVGSEGATSPISAVHATPATGALKPFSSPAENTGAIDIDLGTRLVGPGPLTVGWADSKKQIFLPSGDWILLSAVDSKSSQAPAHATVNRANRVDMTTLAFGKFDGTRLVSLMRFTVSSRKATGVTWTDVNGCDDGGAARLYHARTGSWHDRCISLRVTSDPLRESSAVRDEVRKSLAKLGAKVEGVALVSVLTFAERQLGYLGVTRVDWPGYLPAFASDKESAWRGEKFAEDLPRTAYVKSLMAWAQGYAELAQKGLARDINQPDLTSDGNPTETLSTTVMDDFDPLRGAN